MNTLSLKASTKIGFLGGGQLARMSALQAFRFGFQVAVYRPGTGIEPTDQLTPFTTQGEFSDVDAMVSFAKSCDVVTLENEFIDGTILEEVERISGTPFFPSPASFKKIENKWIEKETFRSAGIPVPPYDLITSLETALDFGNANGYPFILKSSKGGYDGYGNATITREEDLSTAFEQLGGSNGHELLAEAFVDFSCELAVQVARNEHGVAIYPCCESIQKGHICKTIISPARIDPQLQLETQNLALKAMEAIDGKGIFAFEFFLTKDGTILLNESAPRPHNSGHYTIEGCVTSQFENHIRAIVGLPLGSTQLRAPFAVMENILGTYKRPAEAEHIISTFHENDAHLHLYGKAYSKPGRKMGHVTVLHTDVESALNKAQTLGNEIKL